MKRSGVVCPSVLICEEPTTRIGAFLKSCQMREKSSVSPNLIGEKSHDFAAGGFWLLARRLESTVIHSHYKPRADRAKPGYAWDGWSDAYTYKSGNSCPFPKVVAHRQKKRSIRTTTR